MSMERVNSINSGHGELKHMRQKFGPDIHKGMAQELFPNGSVLRCHRCKLSRNCTTSEIENILRNGFPVCKRCGFKVTLDNPK